MNIKPIMCMCNDLHIIECLLAGGRYFTSDIARDKNALIEWCELDGDTYAKSIEVLPHSNMKYINSSRLGKLKYGLQVTSEHCCKTNRLFILELFSVFGKEHILDMYEGIDIERIEVITEFIRDSYVRYQSS